METINVKKTGQSKFGFYVMDENQNFKSVTQEVSNFLTSQLPCTINVLQTIEVKGKPVIERINVISAQTQVPQQQISQQMQPPVQQAVNPNEFEQPVQTVKPGQPELKKGPNYYEVQDKRQEIIINQMSVKAAIEMIKSNNDAFDEKIKPTMTNILTNAKIVKEVLKQLAEPKEELPDY